MTPTRRAKTTTCLTLASTLVVAAASGCSIFDSKPDPGDAARALASALSKGDVSGVAWQGSTAAKANAFVGAAFKGMGTVKPSVSLASIKLEDGSDRATATLASRWDVSPSPTDWTYQTQAAMTLVDGAWQVTWSPRILAPDLAAEETLDLTRTSPQRADIIDPAGKAIVTEREVSVVGIDKTKVSGAAATASAKALATVLDIDPTTYAAKVSAAGGKAFVPALTLRKSDPALAANAVRIDAVTGALRVASLQMLGPTRTWAGPILGTVSEATAEQVTSSKGALRAGDEVGQSGLQYRYDKQLRGTPGLAVQAVKKGADGSALDKRELFAEASKDGESLTVSLDQKAQTAAEAALAQQTKQPTALVVVKVSTGEVLAAAVGPGAGGSTLALAGKNPPGSTFKIASSLALVRKGATPSTKLPCTSTITVNGRRFANYTDFPSNKLGNIPLTTALAFSCNTAFISQYQKVSQAELTSAAQSLGMGETLDLPFTGFLGSVPATTDVVEHAASFIGQGRVEASPLTMAIVVASVMKGQTVRPKLVESSPALPAPATPLKPAEAAVIQQEMRAVVTEGSGKVLAQVGVQYAKTGTAEFGTTNPPQTHAWMVAGRGDLAIAAFNEKGKSGTTAAAPFIISFLKAYDAK
ncbi:MAG: penicillin-binding transpeptidase domain-containing protein [Terracoccus sp.]